MAGFNKATLVGNLGKDPEIRTLESGVKVAQFSIATSESWKDKEGNKQESTEWHNIVLWRGLAEIAEKYLKKGSPVLVEGKITTRSWEDKEGVKRYTTEIVGNNLLMLGKGSGGGGNDAPPPPEPGNYSSPGGGQQDKTDQGPPEGIVLPEGASWDAASGKIKMPDGSLRDTDDLPF